MIADPFVAVPGKERVTVPLDDIADDIVGAPGTVNGVPLDGEEAELGPIALTARTRTEYVVAFASDAIVKVFEEISSKGTDTQVEEPSRLYS